MSLGLTRDSILNLADLARNSDKIAEEDASPPNAAMEENGHDNFLFLDDDCVTMNDTAPPSTKSVSSFPTDNSSVTFSSRNDTEDNHHPPTGRTGSSKYSGFAADYAEYAGYYSDVDYTDPYAVHYGTTNHYHPNKKRSLFCCFSAPWKSVQPADSIDTDSNASDEQADDYPIDETRDTTEHCLSNEWKKQRDDEKLSNYQLISNAESPSTMLVEDDVTSAADTDAHCETLTKMRLSQDSPSSPKDTASIPRDKPHVVDSNKVHESKDTSPCSNNTDLLSRKMDEENTGRSSQIKSILKRTSSKNTDASNTPKKNITAGANEGHSRRLLFPTYESRPNAITDAPHGGGDRAISFSPMARVLTVRSREDMSFMEKAQIWWQRSDYDDFKKTGRIIAKAIVEGGSEVWLETDNAWGKNKRQNGHALNEDDDYNRALSHYSGRDDENDSESSSEEEDGYENKWWCRFGHSRRGLEHIASMEEGRQRQKNVIVAITAVIDEQRSQRISRTKDIKKLASISMQYSAWARDLALAAGAAEAEAVTCKFDQDAKNRAFYMHRGVDGMTTTDHDNNVHAQQRPTFMLSPTTFPKAQILDANTRTTMMLRENQQQGTTTNPKLPLDPQTLVHMNQQFLNADDNGEDGTEHPEAIHDSLQERQQRMAKKAAGFSANSDNGFVTNRTSSVPSAARRHGIGAH